MRDPAPWIVNAVIRYLHKHPGSDIVDIHSALHVDKNAVWTALEWLHSTGLVQRSGVAGWTLTSDLAQETEL